MSPKFPIINQEALMQLIMSQFVDDPIDVDLYPDYSEDLCENENEQAFIDAGHFYGLG